MSEDATSSAENRRRLLALAVAAGSVDAISYLGLAHAFPANMTGNTVLLAIALARGGGGDILPAAVSLAGFSLGVVASGLTIDHRRRWPDSARTALTVHTLILLAVAIAWAITATLSTPTRDILLGCAGLAMGLQSGAVLAAGARGIATTYVTGTLTQALSRLTTRYTSAHEDGESRRIRRLAELDWLLYALRALAGGLLELHARAYCFALPTVLTAACLVRRRSPGRIPAPRGRSHRRPRRAGRR
jgi:uncharacterized membrane protein YoaK (UPF0700 family)